MKRSEYTEEAYARQFGTEFLGLILDYDTELNEELNEKENGWNSSMKDKAPKHQCSSHDKIVGDHNLKHEEYYPMGNFHMNEYRHPDNFGGHRITTYHGPKKDEFSWARTDKKGRVKAEGTGHETLHAHLLSRPLASD
jgi:hypothetical protein